MYDVAPVFREVLSLLPLEELDAIESSLSASDSAAVLLALSDVRKEKASRVTVL